MKKIFSLFAAALMSAVMFAGEPVQYAIKYYCPSNPDEGVYRHIYSTDCADVFGDGTMSYDPEKNELTLNNYQVDLQGAQTAYPIMNEIPGLKIILKGDNKLISGTSTALRLYATTTLTGEGKLTATASGTTSDGIYISADGGNLTIDGCEVIANSAYGIEGSNGTLTITNGAKVSATGAISGSITGWGSIVLGEGIQILSPAGAQIASGQVQNAEGALLKSEVVIGVPAAETVPATSVALDKDTLKMFMGAGTATLKATVLPENTTDFVEWSVVAGGESFVSVVAGTITALAEGEAKVVAKAGNVADTCVVVVGPAPVDYNITVNTTAAGNFQITSANCTDVLNDGGSFKFDNATKTITLTNCHFTSDTYPLVISQSVNIVLVGENSITSTISATALKFASGDATIGGGGKLTLFCLNTGAADGIYCPGGNLTINECEIYAEGGYGIEGESTTLTINPGAKVTAYGPNKGSFTGWGSIVLGEGVEILSPAGAQIVGGDVKDAEGALLKSQVVIGTPEAPVAPEGNGLNPYAYALSSEMTSDDVFTIHYSLNNNAVAGRILLKSGESTKAIALADDQLWLGAHSVAIPVSEMPDGSRVSWSVEISGNSPEAPVQETRMYSMYCPHGVAVDTDPESEYFGRILATEAMDQVKTLSGYISAGANNGAGIYAFAPDFTQIMNGENAVFNGGLNLERLISDYGYAPMRVRISEDGRIFATSCDTNHVAVWELSKDLLTWTPVIAGNNDATDYTIKDADGNFIAGLNASIDLKGQGEDLTLLLYSCDNRGIANSQAGFRLDEYKLGTATTFEGLPTHIAALDGKYGLNVTNTCVVYDGEGGYWFGASRGGNAGQPNLAHINADGIQDYYTESMDYYGGDGILIHNGMLLKGKARTNASIGNFDVYTIGKDQEGKPTLTLKYAVAANGIGRSLNDFAFDYAENLYAVGNSGEKIIAYAFPYSGVVTTPAAERYEYVVEAPAEPVYALNPYAFGVSASSEGESITVNYSLNVDAAEVYAQLFDGETLVASAPLAGITKGAHTETVDVSAAGLPAGTYTGKIAVVGLAHEFTTYADSTITFTNRYHATVDANPMSPNFGNIYGASRGSGVGIYRITPDYTYLNTEPDMIGQSSWSSVQRGAVAPNGEMWFSSWGNDNSGIYRYNPSVDATTCTQFFVGERNNKGLITNNGQEVGCSTPGIAIYSAGKDSKLYLIGEDFTDGSTDGSLAIYNIGQEDGSIVTSWDKAPSAHYNSITDKTGTNFAMAATPYGVWICQNRAAGSNSAGARSLQFIGNDGVQRYLSTDTELINGSYGAGIVTNATFDKLWMVNGNGNIMQFSVAWTVGTVNAAPSLTLDTTYVTPFGAIAQMTFDFAGNIVAVGGTGNTPYGKDASVLRLAVFSLPATEAPVAATPVVGFEYEVKGTGTGLFDNTKAAAKAVKVMRNGHVFIMREGKMFNMQGMIVK